MGAGDDDNEVSNALIKVAEKLTLQPTPEFISRCIAFLKAADVRHALLVLGPPAVGKSAVISVAAGANVLLDRGSTLVKVVNPKAVTRNQLYGYVCPKTGEPVRSALAAQWKRGACTLWTHASVLQNASITAAQRLRGAVRWDLLQVSTRLRGIPRHRSQMDHLRWRGRLRVGRES